VTSVDPEEVASLTGGAAPALRDGDVVERDFEKPLRLGVGRLTAIRRRLEIGLFGLGSQVSEALGATYDVALAGVREVHADVVREGLAEPLAVTRFAVAGQVGWAVWDCGAAVRAVERLLCGSAPDDLERPLSAVESELVSGVLERLVTAVAAASDVKPTGSRAVRSLSTMGTWLEAGDAADPHRVAFDVTLKRGDDTSEVAIYLPGLARPAAGAGADEATELPSRLADLGVELSARLGEVELPLADLLALEDGDVIPLGTPVDGTLAVTVDGHELARAALGTSGGTLAVRLTQISRARTAEVGKPRNDS
jgi:flagellar motor switch protein FliM